ncbi:5-oxoprolinase subunit PxpB [Pseudomonas cremoricolorata]|uniref:Allophanate hydrolase n=1 Tax=Pseudomonas cremoricolorata TaxID=157783 RepID=A0A089WSY0_9PSED|nr:5-oxoprolinase subunit PxpB [Pseudomonas cremoricolorata]AIR91701.1 allophanate hydrolase [Pseudomonas cremoricolorata]
MNRLKVMDTPGSVPVERWTIHPAGDSCLVLTFGQVLDVDTNRRVAHYARQLNEAVLEGELHGVSDIVPAMVSIGVHYRPEQVACTEGQYPYEAFCEQLDAVLRRAGSSSAAAPRVIDVPVCYGGEYGPDLDAVADALKLTPESLIELHGGQMLDVLMVGFAPGHPYIGVLDPRLNPPRRATPRTHVAAGSIGLANRQSVIYPLELPGGWNLIGRTPLTVFDAYRTQPCLMQSGDKIRFVAITPAVFESMREEGRPA